MGFLKLLPAKLRQQLLLNGILAGVSQLEAQHLGKQLREALDAKYGAAYVDPVQKRVAAWLREVSKELEA